MRIAARPRAYPSCLWLWTATAGGTPGPLTKLGRQVARVVGKQEDEAVMQLRQRAAVLHGRDSVEMIRSRSPTVVPPEIDGDE